MDGIVIGLSPADLRSPAPSNHAYARHYLSSSMLMKRRWLLYKRTQDIVLTLLLLVILCLPLICIGLLIRYDSRGPVLFRQSRRGRNNAQFQCYKFRSMFHTCADAEARQQSQRNDPRVTPVGRFLRRLSLDELPQLLNVLKGDMSLIGPRPHAIGTSINGQLLTELSDDYLLRYSVKPGITGWAQVHGWRGILDTEEKLNQRLAHDFDYIINWTPLLDVEILCRTLFVIADKRAF